MWDNDPLGGHIAEYRVNYLPKIPQKPLKQFLDNVQKEVNQRKGDALFLMISSL